MRASLLMAETMAELKHSNRINSARAERDTARRRLKLALGLLEDSHA